MPRPPAFATAVRDVSGSVYTTLAGKLAAWEGECYAFHVGDTWMEPAEGTRMQDLSVDEHPGMHRYTAPQGHPALIEAVRGDLARRYGWDLDGDEILIAAGATGALGAIAGAVLDAGDEVLLAAPYWPLIEGIVRSFRGTPVPVPVFAPRIRSDRLIAAFDAAVTERTVAVYWNTPNNPSGRALEAAEIEALVGWACERNLWVLADEVYEAYLFDGGATPARDFDPERVFSVHSFSKTFGMAGNRCGYVVGPGEALEQARKISTHTFYSTPTASQLAAVESLRLPAASEWVNAARAMYREVGHQVARILGVEPPQGSTFLFLDLADRLNQRGPDAGGLDGLLSDLADRGVFLAPGPSFGPFPHHARLCFTAVPPEVTLRGVEILAEFVGRRS